MEYVRTIFFMRTLLVQVVKIYDLCFDSVINQRGDNNTYRKFLKVSEEEKFVDGGGRWRGERQIKSSAREVKIGEPMGDPRSKREPARFSRC
jgi:hypothetical protein